MGHCARKGMFAFPPCNTMLGRHSTPPGTTCVVLQLQIWQWASGILCPPLCGVSSVHGQAGWATETTRGLGTLWELQAMGDAAVAFTQAAQVALGVSPWCPKAERIGRGLQLMQKCMHNMQNSKEKWPFRKRSMCTVFVSTALSHRTQAGKPKYLPGVSLNSFPLLLS